jgi:hypothetical protein
VKAKIAFLTLLSVLVAVVAFWLVPVASAASPEQDCQAAGGVYTHDGPNSTCVISNQQPVGNSDNTKGTTTTETGPGKSDPNSDTTSCTGITNPSGSRCK